MASSSSNVGKEREGVERMMEKMNLTERESAKLLVDDQEDSQVPSFALIGKVLHRRVLHVNTIADAMRPAWGNPRGMNFSSVGENVFVVNLETKRDRDRIWEGGPWTVGKHAVVLESFDFRSRPDDWKFEKMQIWARVTKLPYNLRCAPWPKKIADMLGEVIKVDTDAKGFAWGDALRARIWIKVKEPLMRWVQLESARTKEVVFYDIQYEHLPYFCFSCGVLGHADLYCPCPAGRDHEGRLPYKEELRFSMPRRTWESAPRKNPNQSYEATQEEEEGEEEEGEAGEEVNSPSKINKGSVTKYVYQFNARGGGNAVRGSGACRGRGRAKAVYRRVNLDGVASKGTAGAASMIVDQETLNKKRLNEDELSNDSKDSRDSKKKKAQEMDIQSKEAEAASQPRQDK